MSLTPEPEAGRVYGAVRTDMAGKLTDWVAWPK
jgi:hypothetical protein